MAYLHTIVVYVDLITIRKIYLNFLGIYVGLFQHDFVILTWIFFFSLSFVIHIQL